MKNRLWFLMPIVWLAQLFNLLLRPQPMMRCWLIRVAGLLALAIGLALMVVSSDLKVPIAKVAVGIIGLGVAFFGLLATWVKKQKVPAADTP